MDQKKKTVYYVHGEPQVFPTIQTEFPIIKMVYPDTKGVNKYSTVLKEIIFWYYFPN
jgi:hypothetical protein